MIISSTKVGLDITRIHKRIFSYCILIINQDFGRLFMYEHHLNACQLITDDCGLEIFLHVVVRKVYVKD